MASLPLDMPCATAMLLDHPTFDEPYRDALPLHGALARQMCIDDAVGVLGMWASPCGFESLTSLGADGLELLATLRRRDDPGRCARVPARYCPDPATCRYGECMCRERPDQVRRLQPAEWVLSQGIGAYMKRESREVYRALRRMDDAEAGP